jgi:hypothetical protein
LVFDIIKVKKKDAIYTCTTCTSISDKKKTTLAIAKRSEEYSKAHKLTLTEDLLVEELEQRCQACNNSIQNGGDSIQHQSIYTSHVIYIVHIK